MPREIKGVEALAQAFPSEWLLYVSLNCFPRNQDAMEIDAFVVLDQCVLLFEIKDWNGALTASGDRWLVNGRSRGRSAVIQSSEKAKKLKTVLKGELGAVGSRIWVEHRVVLTGTATKQALPPAEVQYVWTLAEACSIADPTKRKALLPSGSLRLIKLYQLESDFDRVTGNTKLFQPLEADWSGFQVVEPDVFVHPRGIWRDHRAERKGEARIKAMIRTWFFDRLPPGLNSPERRRTVAHRETQAFAYLQEMGSGLVAANRVLREIASPQEEVLTRHFEVRSIVQGWTTLDRYLERAHDELTFSDRIVIASGLLNLVSQLHQLSVTHRDLGPKAVWIGSPSDLAITGLMSCQLPDQKTVVDWLTDLRGYAPQLPEDRSPKRPSTGRQRDVYSCAHLISLVLGLKELVKDPQPSNEAQFLRPWLARGLESEPALRFSDAISMKEDFSNLVEPKQPAAIDQTLLDRFEKNTIPYLHWTSKVPLSSKPTCEVYKSSLKDGKAVTVKVWNGLRRGTSTELDLALLRLLDSARRLESTPTNGFPNFVDSGLSPVGPYIVYEHCIGKPLGEVATFAAEDALCIGADLLSAVVALHALECDHGDISPSNVLYEAAARRITLVDAFDLTPVGDGRTRTPTMCPTNWERLGQQALDRFASLKVFEEVIGKCPELKESALATLVRDELARPAVESLEAISTAIAKVSQERAAPAPVRIEISTLADTNGFEGGRGFYVHREASPKGVDQVVISSTKGQLLLEGDGHAVTSQRFRRIGYSALAHQSRVGKRVDVEIALAKGNDRGFDDLYQHLTRGAEARHAEAPGEEVAGSDPHRPFDVTWYWRRLLELEEEARVEIEITELIGNRDGTVVCRYENLGNEFDFDAEAAVDVYSSTNKRIGEVDRALSDFPSSIGINVEARRISVGTRLRLADRKEQTSIDRRAKAIDRILEGRSIIPNLIDYFDPALDIEPTEYGLHVAESDLDAYRLNEGQKLAFRHLLQRGPVGLLQGPPGTGKTRFIASFVHWLLTKGGSQRILVASQSHEAVNNAIDSLLLLYKRLGGKPNLLRIGSKGITNRIKPYHSAELRERYRVRFEAAAKFRFLQLTSAKGISRDFASQLFDIDASLGILARRRAAIQSLAENDEKLSSAERDRNRSLIRRLDTAIVVEARQRLGHEVDVENVSLELERLFEELADRHDGVSPADTRAAKEILSLTRDWLSSLASPQRNFEEFLAKTRSVVTATCVGVGQTRIRIDSQVFDWVIVDEAARCTPGELAVPIQMAKRVLLVGDHLQLRPMVSRELLEVIEEETEIDGGRAELQGSDFERSFTSKYGAAVGSRFTEQYRMDPAICRMVSRCFYEPHSVSLNTSAERVGRTSFSAHGARWLRVPMTWVDTSGHSRSRELRPQNSTTRYNAAEVEAVIAVLASIAADQALVTDLSEGEDESPIGVICMYKGQKDRLEAAWTQHAWDPKFRRLVRIDTVDAYQGKENTIVILSLVCNNKHRNIGHVRSSNRCNVAVSRARDRLVVVGAREMWESLPEQTSPMTSVLRYMLKDSSNACVISSEELG